MQRRNVKGASAPARLAGRGAGVKRGSGGGGGSERHEARAAAAAIGRRVVQACCFLSSGVGGRMGSTDHSLGVLLPAPHHSRAGNDRCPCRYASVPPGKEAPDARNCGRIRAVAVSGADSMVGEVASVSSVLHFSRRRRAVAMWKGNGCVHHPRSTYPAPLSPPPSSIWPHPEQTLPLFCNGRIILYFNDDIVH